MWGVNIACSHSGLAKMGIDNDIGNTALTGGQLADSKSLGDPGSRGNDDTFTPDWISQFKDLIHGVIIISGDSHLSVDAIHATVSCIFSVGFKPTLHEGLTLQGFGLRLLDGISQPAVKDFDTKPDPGQQTVRQGIILCGREHDVDLANTGQPFARPIWALDESFLSLRYLKQLVPEFNAFLEASVDPLHGLTADLVGARLMGRWKSDVTYYIKVRRRTCSPARQPGGWHGPCAAQRLLGVRPEQPGALPHPTVEIESATHPGDDGHHGVVSPAGVHDEPYTTQESYTDGRHRRITFL
uniref:Cytochrome P450 monooxygenase AKT7 ) n=1 Tax=Ganoderma boninense TaxID=34458 RepID=A0A5K1K313_9APHY|nr:Cytochrome P450 monooxygenase AKT7 (EC (AK-toxin biosynthesis protein 7) [Ganoderma boninense]